MNPTNLKYSPYHTWARVEGDIIVIGITDFAQTQLRDIVFASIFEDEEAIKSGESFGSLESVKSVSDVIAPLSAKLVEVNQAALDNPEIINQDPYGKGYLIKVATDDASQLDALMTASEYEAMLAQQNS